jgi:hypothetical protein
MQTIGTCAHRRLVLGAAVFLLTIHHVRLLAQAPADVESLLARVGERIEQYFARAQSIVFVEKTTIQYIGTDLMPQGFARVLESDIRVESFASNGDSDGSPDTKILRDLRKINGHAPRATRDSTGCLDPNPVSPEPLAFLLPEQRSDYEFTLVGPGRGKEQNFVMIDFRELGTGKPEVKQRSDKGERCFTIDVPGRGRGRVWIDVVTYEVMRVDQRLTGRVDFRLPDPKNRRIGLEDVQVLERLDTSIRYKPVTFSDPEEVVQLPESIETLMVVRGLQSYRMKQAFSGYRRFVTGARLVK